MLSKQNHELAGRDGYLPGLGLLLDTEAFARHWSANRRFPRRAEVAIEYIRYKPSRRCIVVYRVRCGDTSQQVVATAHNVASWRKHRDTFDRATCDTDPHSGDALAAAWVSAGCFPCDRKLRRLQELRTTDLAMNFICSFVDKQIDEELFALKRAAYKPERRAVYEVQTAEDRKYALKFFDKRSFEQAKTRGRVWDRCRKRLRERGVELPKLFRANSHRRITVSQWLDGRNLAEAMGASRLPLDVFFRVGSALGELHCSSPRDLPQNSDSPRSLRRLAEDIVFLVPDLHCAANFYANEIQTALDTVDSIQAPIHGDFYAKQVCIAKHSIGILDFDQSAMGNPLCDVGNFIAKLIWNSQRGDFDGDQIVEIESAFLSGYASKSGAQDQGEIDLHVASGLFKCVTHPFRCGMQDWPKQTSALMQLVRDRFDRYRRHVHRSSARPTFDVAVANRAFTPTRPHSDGSSLQQEILRSAPTPWIADALIAERARATLLKSCPQLAKYGPRLDVMNVEPIRHKPGRRCLIRYDIHVAQSQSTDLQFSVIGKTRFKGVDRHAFRIQSELWHAGLNDSNIDGVAVPKPLGIDPSSRTWFQEFVPGETFEQMLQSGNTLLCELPARTARSLATLHSTVIDVPCRNHSSRDEVRLLLERLEKVATEKPEYAVAIEAVTASATEIAETLCDEPRCGIHRDFYPAQVISTTNRIQLVDFDLYCRGPADLDAGNYLGHLWELAIRFPERANILQSAADQFTEAYRATFDRRTRPSRIESWAWLTLARHIWISTQISGRSHTTSIVIDEVLRSRRVAIGRPGKAESQSPARPR
jgi:Ser/Thr protein kinase RdoA (MazF antagonist)